MTNLCTLYGKKTFWYALFCMEEIKYTFDLCNENCNKKRVFLVHITVHSNKKSNYSAKIPYCVADLFDTIGQDCPKFSIAIFHFMKTVPSLLSPIIFKTVGRKWSKDFSRLFNFLKEIFPQNLLFICRIISPDVDPVFRIGTEAYLEHCQVSKLKFIGKSLELF